MPTPLWMSIEPRGSEIRLLLSEPAVGTKLKARLPSPPRHPRALPMLLEAVSAWYRLPLHAVLDADASAVRLEPEQWSVWLDLRIISGQPLICQERVHTRHLSGLDVTLYIVADHGARLWRNTQPLRDLAIILGRGFAGMHVFGRCYQIKRYVGHPCPHQPVLDSPRRKERVGGDDHTISPI